ncbi:hypothetical protein MPRM_21210 [Mycobacterium parmense]|uniref:Uncharacterized protein n=1 Tax=Mycobacterium parmense TaxID=185642 RepID=A0A7I7YSZ0_9MYCO|nr:hypothetical protein MPRM_21210 [Mycobacterium parmense]
MLTACFVGAARVAGGLTLHHNGRCGRAARGRYEVPSAFAVVVVSAWGQ